MGVFSGIFIKFIPYGCALGNLIICDIAEEIMESEMKTNLASVVDDLRYMNSLGMKEFCGVFGFKTDEEGMPLFDYEQDKWRLFRENPLHFLWGLDSTKLHRLENWITKTKGGEE